MSLYGIFINEKQIKTNEIYNRYRKLILNSRYVWHVTMTNMESKLYDKVVQLFYGATDEKDNYRFILIFTDDFFKIDNLVDSTYFDKEFTYAKAKMRKKYRNDDYYRKIEEFLSQGDEEIIKKIAHYLAYKEAKKKLFETDLQLIKTAFNKSKGIGKTFDVKDETIEEITAKLAILNGYYKGEKIMQDDEFNNLLSNLKAFASGGFDSGILNNLKIKPIPATKLTNDYIRAVLYEIYKKVLPKHQAPEQRKNFIQFIRASFAKLASESENTTDKKFAIDINTLKHITNKITLEKPIS